MLFSPQIFVAFLNRTRYPFSPLVSPFLFSSFSTIKAPRKSSTEECESDNKFNPNIDESKILNELCNLLPVKPSNSVLNLYTPPLNSSPIRNHSEIRVSPDGFLPLEDKLRGVFLQKLKGKALVDNALDTALADKELSIDVVSRVLDRGNLGGEAMVMFFNWAIEQPGISDHLQMYHVILMALGRRKLFEFMVDKFREMNVKGIKPDCESLMIVMDSFIRARHVSRAVELFWKLGYFGIDFDIEALNVLLRCLCRRSHVGIANSILYSMKGKVGFDVVSYNVVIGGWARLGSVCEMEKCLKAMVEDGINPNCETYSCLIEGLGRAGQVDDAVKIFRSMESEDCRPDTNVYNAMISNYVSISDFDECMTYYEEMCRNNCMPDLHTYTKLISGLLKARKVADALELFDAMLCRGVSPTTGTITSFIEPLCSYGPPQGAMMIYKSARKAGCKISLTAYKLLLMRLSRFGKCGMILKLWDDMQECGYCSDMEVYEYVINGLYNNGQLDMAVFVMEEALRKGFCPSRLMCSKLNKKLVALNKTESAYKLFLKIKQARIDDNAKRYWRANGWHF